MPELPEVETIRRGLESKIVGAVIENVQILNPNSAQFSEDDKVEYIIGRKISYLHRRGKVLIIDLSSQYSLLMHLKMTGQLILDHPAQEQIRNFQSEALNKSKLSNEGNPKNLEFRNSQLGFAKAERFGGGHPSKSLVGSLPDKSTRIVFGLDKGKTLYFNDQRKFGWVKLLPTGLLPTDSLLDRMGPEPWSEELTLEYLKNKFKGRKAPIKAMLLDQSVIAGIGNIYADEALHYAGIYPGRLAGTITEEEAVKLIAGIRQVMDNSLGHGGTSFSDYVNHLGFFGDYLRHARVFNRTGQPCRICGTEIIKTRIAGRGTHFCPSCQK